MWRRWLDAYIEGRSCFSRNNLIGISGAKTSFFELYIGGRLVLVLDSQRALLVFSTGGEMAALPIESVERIVPMAQLTRPPGLPSPVEGILNLGGTAVPVLRLNRLLRLPVQSAGLYSMLIVLKNLTEGRFALLVARVSEAVAVSSCELLPVDQQDSFNACAEASFLLRGQTVPLLLPQRILLEKETRALSEFQALAQQRIEDWGEAAR